MACIGSGFCIGSLVKHKGIKKYVLGIEYILESDYSEFYPGKRLVTYLRLGNELVNPFDVVLLSITGSDVDKNINPILSVCKFKPSPITDVTFDTGSTGGIVT
jgi:hypothetical protein